MEASKFNYDTLAQRLREMAFLNKGLKITLTDEREDPEKHDEFLYKGGIAEFIRYLNRGKTRTGTSNRFISRKAKNPAPAALCGMEIALINTMSGYAETLFSFANNINMADGGNASQRLSEKALTRTINFYGQQAGLFKDAQGET